MAQLTEFEVKKAVGDINNLGDLSTQDFPTVVKYLDRVAKFILDVGVILLKEGEIKKLRWYHLATYWRIGDLIVQFIKDLGEIRK
jgi:hypothetical protein